MQVLYLESLRIRARELPSLEFFKETLRDRGIGLETERGALTFSLVKHSALALVIGCLTLASAVQEPLGWQAAGGLLLVSWLTMLLTTYMIPQIVYRKSSGRGLLPLVPLLRAIALAGAPLVWVLEFLAIPVRTGAADSAATKPPRRKNTSKR